MFIAVSTLINGPIPSKPSKLIVERDLQHPIVSKDFTVKAYLLIKINNY